MKPQIKSVVFVFLHIILYICNIKTNFTINFPRKPTTKLEKNKRGHLTLIKREKYDRRQTFKRKRILLYFL